MNFDRVIKGVFCDVEDFDAIPYLKQLAERNMTASVYLTCTPENVDRISQWTSQLSNVAIWVRLNFGYHPRGTVPPSGTREEADFIAGVLNAVRKYKTVTGWIIGNEPNNPIEWPAGKNITAKDYARLFSSIWWKAPLSVWLSPAPVDPFNPTLGGGYAFWIEMWQELNRVRTRPEFLTFQAKTLLAVPPLKFAAAKFTDDPLRDRSMGFGTVLSLLATAYRYIEPKAIVIAECNPQYVFTRFEELKPHTGFGWPSDQLCREWIRESLQLIRLFSFLTPQAKWYVHFYRWSRDAWEIRKRDDILSAILVE